ncbi:MAG: hypothetical protein EX271_01795 [Acidimicrobiales bacterium]|nr:hypothetical protein [Hyphomonadaceae bacterium]RZV44384.1 MAG: hypothetical protein EX271_01795 [Acidimicrobiales bacterium]
MKSIVLTTCAFLLAQTAQAQIISQTPRPDVQNPEAESVETLKPQGRVGTSGNTVAVARTGALLFAGFDRNDDYKIDRGEVSDGIERAFERADTDGTGALSLVELEAWRVDALGAIDATPNNFAFAPNFARSVSLAKFKEVLTKVADTLDKDADGNMDGVIKMADLLKNQPLRTRSRDGEDENCLARIRDERRRVEQICRSQRGY